MSDDDPKLETRETTVTMLNCRMSRFLIAVVVVATFSLPGLSTAQEDNPDISAFACKDIMRISGPDRDIAIALMHGYLLAEKESTSFSTEALAGASEEFIESCLDNPTAKALETLRDASN